MECLAVFTSIVALADRRPQLYSTRSEGFHEYFIEEIFRELREHLDQLDGYKGDAITLHGSRSTGARLAQLVGMTEEELANMLVRTLSVERPSMLFGALRLFNTFEQFGLEEAGTAALRSAANLTPSLAMARSLSIVRFGPRDCLVDSEETLYSAQLQCVMMWHTTLNETAYGQRHAAQAIRDGMISWLGEFTKSRLLDKAAGTCPSDNPNQLCIS